MRIIPGKIKVQIELFKGISMWDLLVGAIEAVVLALAVSSTLPHKWLIVAVHLVISVLLLVRIDKEPNYVYLINIIRHFGFKRKFDRMDKDATLEQIASKGLKTVAFEKAFFEEENGAQTEPSLSKADLKAQKKAAKAERKADDKLLRSKKLSKEEEDAIWLKRAEQSAAKKQAKTDAKAEKHSGGSRDNWAEMEELSSFTDIKDGFISYHGEYFGAALEVPCVEFRFFSEFRRKSAIESGLGSVLRSLKPEYCVNILKIERPVEYDGYIDNEYAKLDELKRSFEQGMLTEEELKVRAAIVYDRLGSLLDFKEENKVVIPFYYIVLFDSDKTQLNNQIETVTDSLRHGEMSVRRLWDRDLALLLKYSNTLEFDENDIDRIRPEDYAKWAMPESVEFCPRISLVNGMATHNFRVVSYPQLVDDAWLASLMTYPSTKVMIKAFPMDSSKAISTIDRSIAELRGNLANARTDSAALSAEAHLDSLQQLLATLQSENETLLSVNIYVTAYDSVYTENNPKLPSLPGGSFRYRINNMKSVIRRVWREDGFRLNNMEFNQAQAYIGSQISGYDPMLKKGRVMPSNTVAATFPWIFPHIMDPSGFCLGSEGGVPVFIDFFTRSADRVNSNMVIVGKSGSGKSYATKALLSNLAADDSKIFILDPEDEYTVLAKNLHGKYINVATDQFGILNPFHIITALEDDTEAGSGNSYSTHLQFLEEFFKQILPDCDKDSLEYLNNLVDRVYRQKGITPATDLTKLRPEDYPIFDDLYDEILREFQKTTNDYIKLMLRTLMNYIVKFASGGRNSVIWNGPSSITTDENFTVFNFQSLLANRNSTIANAQMLLVLKYIDNEIIKNRDYNEKYGLNRKVVVVIDEAHVFIDTKYPAALDFMFQLAKRIRKYNGMQIVITQNIKDFVGSEEIARKSTAIINACQYSFIFSLAPNDMDDLCRLYEKAGGINESEQEQIVQAPRGQTFTVMSPVSRSSFKVVVPEDTRQLFSDTDFVNPYFEGEGGAENWNAFAGDAVSVRKKAEEESFDEVSIDAVSSDAVPAFEGFSFTEINAEDAAAEASVHEPSAEKQAARKELPEESAPLIFEEINEEEFIRRKASEAKDVRPSSRSENDVPVIIQAPSSSRTEELLANLVDKLGTDSMADEIRRAVKDEVEKEVARRMAEVSACMPAPKEAEAENDEGIIGSIFDTAFGEDEARSEEDSVKSSAEDSAEDSFDVLAFLSQMAEESEETDSAVEDFINGTETKRIVSLEQLMQFNRRN